MGKVFESVRQAVDRLATKGRQSWLKLSVRERALVVGCAVVALLVAPVLAADWAQGAGDRVIAARSALDDRRAIHPASGSARALDEVMAEVEAWSYVSDTAPLARIGLQNQLATTAQAAGLTDVRLVIDDDLILDRGIPLVRAEVSAAFSWDGLTAFFDGLSFAQNGYLLESVRRSGPSGSRLEVVLLAPVRTFEVPVTGDAGAVP